MNLRSLPVPTGTGDLFTALCTAWLTKTEGDLKVSLERTIATMQAVLTRQTSPLLLRYWSDDTDRFIWGDAEK